MTDLFTALQEAAGYIFSDPALALQALTHSSYAKTHHMHGRDNERLEFLGDAVLEMVVSRYLYENYPSMREGEMTRSRQHLVREEYLFDAANKIGLGGLIRMDESEEKIGGRSKPSIVSDAFEAVIAAIYLDGGYEEAKQFIGRTILSGIDRADLLPDKDAKSTLQELIAKRPEHGTVRYELTGESGPEHKKIFAVRVLVDGVPYGAGEGSSKQQAEQHAAAEALRALSAEKE